MKSSRSRLDSKAGRSLRLAAFAGVLLAGAAGSAEAHNFSGVRVDLSGANGSVSGRTIQAALENRLRYYFAADLHGDRSAPLLVVRITGITLDVSPATSSNGVDGGGHTDYLEGEALVVGRGGAIIERYPMLAALAADQGGWYLPTFEKRKSEALANHYAYWLKRQLPER